jgi:pyruvate formate lyase activating enzyme
VKKARYYNKADKKMVGCTACEWRCEIKEGASGVCGVRVNEGGDLYSLVYGRAVDAYGDWIEKKKLAHFLPGSMAFSIGTLGCNFACDFCLNWQISQAPKVIKEKLRREGRPDDLDAEITSFGYDLPPEKVIEYCKKKKYPVVAFTYNEPTVFIEYAEDIAEMARKEGIKSVFVTNGYMSEEVVFGIAEKMDAASVDLKAFSEKFYKKHCKASLDPVLRNLKLLHKEGVWLEITTLIIPGENDSPSELRKIAEFIAAMSVDIPWHITRFTPDYKLLDKPRTPEQTLYDTYDMAKEIGLNYVYFGNLWDVEKTSTYCPSCGKLLISRDTYDITLTPDFDPDGSCRKCGKKISGVW